MNIDDIWPRSGWNPEKAPLLEEIWNFHATNIDLIYKSKGSNKKHQAWEGGYVDHIEQCLTIGKILFDRLPLSRDFTFWDVFVVIYLHDVEKIWKYTTGEIVDKEKILSTFSLTAEQRNAIKYIHGEGEDYSEERVMNELAAFCHCCDILSSRMYYNRIILG